MNHISRDLIAKGVVEVYMDDILVHTVTIEEHRQVTRDVLRILQENNLFLKPEKCVFHQNEVEYLGMIVGNGTVKMDPAKILAIKDWPVPKNKRELQRFLGFCNYYRRFIKNYSKHAKPLTILTGNTDYQWSSDQQTAFETLIHAVTSEPTLAMPNQKGQFRIEADSSDYAIGAILSQKQDDKWHPIAYLSKALTETQRNYEIYDKEMLAIMLSLNEWRHYLIGAEEVFEVWTDHQNLQYFRQPQKVNRRQARWLTELSEYHFTLHHKPGDMNVKADFLSRPPGLDKGENDNQNVILLPEHHFKTLFSNLQDAQPLNGTFPETIRERLSRYKNIKNDKYVQKALNSNDPQWNDHGDGIITYKNRIYIPPDPRLQNEIIHEHHDTIAAGHPGRYKTQELITRDYWWPRITQDVIKYVEGCESCQRTKVHRNKPHNPLHPHEIPTEPWEHISIDIIGPLPMSNGYDAILVIVDRFSKMIILQAINTTLNAVQTAEIYRDHVWSKHGLPKKIISDRGPQFVNQFMTDLHRLTGVKANPSTAYHPQTDGQTERMNQEIEQYLRLFINHRQTDWSNWLACAEFSYNDRIQSSTGHSPFFVNYGRHPYKGTNTQKEVKSQSAVEFKQQMDQIWEETQAALRLSAEQMKKFYDRKREPSRNYQVGDMVWLEGYNIPTNQPSKKLGDKRYGPFKILSKHGAAAYKLSLPKTWRSIWPIFNEIFLTPYVPPTFPTQKMQQPPPLPEVVDDHEEYEVQEIMDSRLYRGKIRYLVKWTGYEERHHWTWEPLRNLENAQQAIKNFHKSHPSAPRSVDHANFKFKPIPQLQYTEISTEQTPNWEDRKVQVDHWSLEPGWQPFTEEELAASRQPPKEPVRRPPPDYTKKQKHTDEGHSTMHWSFCRIEYCPYHRGDDSWYG
jgi:transposase InsO family protein